MTEAVAEQRGLIEPWPVVDRTGRRVMAGEVWGTQPLRLYHPDNSSDEDAAGRMAD